MSHLNNAGYRILSFKYDPTKFEKDAATEEKSTKTANQCETAELKSTDEELPSMSSLMTSLQEIQDSDLADVQTDPPLESGDAPPPVSPTSSPLTEFHCFGNLPTELRIKIWNMAFLPRVVELRPTRPNYAPAHTDLGRSEFQSGCTNPAVLSVNIEARELALEHFRIAFPLASITTNVEEKMSRTHSYEVPSAPWNTYNFKGSSLDGKGKLLRRLIYLSPEHDTVVLLGQDSDISKLRHVMNKFQEYDPLFKGIKRLGLSVRGWGYGGSAVMLKTLNNFVLKPLDQLYLFMYGEHWPPIEFREKGSAIGGEWLEKYRKTGNKCELVPCEGSNAWYAYRVWSGGQGRQFWDADGNIMKIGMAGNDLKIMDLEFKDGW